MNKVSVIVPSYNSFLTIRYLLDALLKQPQDLLEEIIVVDSSDDGQTPRILEGFKTKGVNIIRLDKKTIPALARNIGVTEARAEWLAFIDSDATPDKDWLENISAAFESGCRVGGGSILLPDFQSKSLIAAAQYFLQFNEFMDVGEKREKDFVPSCNLFCEKILFQSIGGFPNIRACEDVIFGRRVKRAAPLYFFPEIKVSHIFRENLTAYLKNQELLGRYIIVFRRSELKQWIYRGVIPAVLLPLFLLVKLVGITSRIISGDKAGDRRLFFLCFPLFFMGLCAWGKGFLKGCFKDDASEK